MLPNQLIFLCYINRSGSTFLSNYLDNFEDIFVYPEAEILIREFLKEPLLKTRSDSESIIKRLISDKKFRHWFESKSEIEKIVYPEENKFKVFLNILTTYRNKYNSDSRIYLFKASNILKYLPSIYDQLKTLSTIKLIHIVRDGRAAYASQKKYTGSRNNERMEVNPGKAAIKWKNYLSDFNRLKNVDLKLKLEVKYEDLINNYQNETEKILNFISLENTTNKDTKFYKEMIPTEQLHLHQNINKPPDATRTNSWEKELSSEEIYLYENNAKDQLLKKGYELKNITLPLYKRIKAKLYFEFYGLVNFSSKRWKRVKKKLKVL